MPISSFKKRTTGSADQRLKGHLLQSLNTPQSKIGTKEQAIHTIINNNVKIFTFCSQLSYTKTMLIPFIRKTPAIRSQ